MSKWSVSVDLCEKHGHKPELVASLDCAVCALEDRAKHEDCFKAWAEAGDRAARLARENAALVSDIKWMAQIVHQAHHEGSQETCVKSICVRARDVCHGIDPLPPVTHRNEKLRADEEQS